MQNIQEAQALLVEAARQGEQGNTDNQARTVEKIIKLLTADLVGARLEDYNQSALDLTPVLFSREQALTVEADLYKNGQSSTVGAMIEIRRAVGVIK